MMKSVNYFGQPVTVPDYANYIATDKDGEMWWYVCEPRGVKIAWFNFGGNNCGRIGNNPNIKNWRRSLREC